MKTIKGKELKGFGYADGIHYYWGDEEVAVINEQRKEIEWCNRTFHFPKEVVKEIRNLVPYTPGIFTFEVRRTRQSVTQGTISVFLNGKDMNMHFADNIQLIDGKWQSTVSDEELGKYVYACLWHKYDNAYHYSDRFKSFFKPDWNKEIEVQTTTEMEIIKRAEVIERTLHGNEEIEIDTANEYVSISKYNPDYEAAFHIEDCCKAEDVDLETIRRECDKHGWGYVL